MKIVQGQALLRALPTLQIFCSPAENKDAQSMSVNASPMWFHSCRRRYPTNTLYRSIVALFQLDAESKTWIKRLTRLRYVGENGMHGWKGGRHVGIRIKANTPSIDIESSFSRPTQFNPGSLFRFFRFRTLSPPEKDDQRALRILSKSPAKHRHAVDILISNGSTKLSWKKFLALLFPSSLTSGPCLDPNDSVTNSSKNAPSRCRNS